MHSIILAVPRNPFFVRVMGGHILGAYCPMMGDICMSLGYCGFLVLVKF